MKKFLLIFGLFPLLLSAQTLTDVRMTISIAAFVSATPGDYQGVITTVGSTGYDFGDVQVGDIFFDQYAYQYSIDSIVILTANTQARVWVTALDVTPTAPAIGRGSLSRHTAINLPLFTQVGSNYIPSETQAKMLTHVMIKLDSIISAGGLADGDKGDITVTSSGSVWTIDNSAVTYAKIQDVTANRLLGRISSTGALQEIPLATGLYFNGSSQLASSAFDSLSTIPSGSGTTGTLAYWSGTATLGSSNVNNTSYGASVSGTGAFLIPGGTIAQAPGTPALGMLRYATDTWNRPRWYNGSAFENILAANLTAGQVVYPDANGKPTGTNNFFWKSSSNQLLLGSSTATEPHDLVITATAHGGGISIKAGGNNRSTLLKMETITSGGTSQTWELLANRSSRAFNIVDVTSNTTYFSMSQNGILTLGNSAHGVPTGANTSDGLYIYGNGAANRRGLTLENYDALNPNSSETGVYMNTKDSTGTYTSSMRLLNNTKKLRFKNSVNNSGAIDWVTTTSSVQNTRMLLSNVGYLGIGDTVPTAYLTLPIGTTSAAQIKMPSSVAPSSPNNGDIWNYTTQKALTMRLNGATVTFNSTLFTGTATATVGNTAVETSIMPTGVGTYTMPADFFVAGKTIEINAWGYYTTDALVKPTVTVKLYKGSTLLASTGAQTLDLSPTAGQWHTTTTTVCYTTGSSGTVFTQGETNFWSGTLTTTTRYPMANTSTTTINTTTSGDYKIQILWGAADADDTMTLTNIKVSVIQ